MYGTLDQRFHKKNAKCLNGLQSSVESASQTSKMTVQKLEESVSKAMNATVTTLHRTSSDVNDMSYKIIEQLSAISSTTNSRINDEQSSMVTWQADLKQNLVNLQKNLTNISDNIEDLSKSVEDVLTRACTSISAYINQIEMVSWLVGRFFFFLCLAAVMCKIYSNSQTTTWTLYLGLIRN